MSAPSALEGLPEMLVKTGPKKFYGTYSPIGGKAAAAVAGFAKGVNVNGSTYIASSPANTALTTTDGKKYLISFWFRMTGAPAGFVILYENILNTGVSLARDGSGTFYIQGQDSANNNVATFVLGSNLVTDTNWHHIVATADRTAGSINQVVLDGTLLVTYSFANASANNIAFAAANTNVIGARNGGSLAVTGDLAELYIAHNQTIDLAIAANVQKFRSVSGHPVDLGATGSTPTGTAPTQYFSVRAPSGVANDFLTNRGTGGLTWSVAAGTLGLATVDP
jgi:hypothetical protein